MKLFLLSNNTDTATGMRLAGVESVIVENEIALSDALKKAAKDEDIAIILINRSLCEMCDTAIKQFRKSHSIPVIVEIPDKGGEGSGESLAKYIRETVGINI